jgi:hypothetical protein
MSEVHLIRAKMAYQTSDYYEEKTDVWLFGDVSGYRSLQETIRRASAGHRLQRPACGGAGSNSMRACILRPSSSPRHQPRLKLVERIVFLDKAPEMELIVYGNDAGYEWLNEMLDRAFTDYLDDPSEHVHVDDHRGGPVVRRSVALNIRGAVGSWSREALGDYASFVFDRQPTYLPSDIGYLTKALCPYEDPTAGEFPFTLR